MGHRLRFAVISDPHIALPETIWQAPQRFHLVEVSIPALEHILEHLVTLDLDFLLLPGDLTQHGERLNHRWLAQRLAQLPFPVYVVPGNHDVIARDGTEAAIALSEFPQIYQAFGYSDGKTLYYQAQLRPGVQLIGLNANQFDDEGRLLSVGYLDQPQLAWLEQRLALLKGEQVLVMLHHNVLEHLPGQARSPLGQRYLLRHRQRLIRLLEQAGVQLLFTGHLHVQDVARRGRLCEVLTGSLVSYPHPYRLIEISQTEDGAVAVAIESPHLQALPGWPDLQRYSFDWMGDRAGPFIVKLLTNAPFNLPPSQAAALAPDLRDFWATIAAGDPQFDFSPLPPSVQQLLAPFDTTGSTGQPQRLDNAVRLVL
jgi:predicted phosphodiesterase